MMVGIYRTTVYKWLFQVTWDPQKVYIFKDFSYLNDVAWWFGLGFTHRGDIEI